MESNWKSIKVLIIYTQIRELIFVMILDYVI